MIGSKKSVPNTGKPIDVELKLETEKLSENEGVLHLSIIPPKDGVRQNSTFICAIDISGSMQGKASLDNDKETNTFSRLDLVKHSLKTIINILEPTDNLCLVPFDDNATVNFKIQPMTPGNKTNALSIVEKLISRGSTNIWDALNVSIREVRNSPICKNTNNFILLFTDGQPNVNPPNGILSEMVKTLESIPKYHEMFTVHTFGYGYNLDSVLLHDIALVGSGIYNYIPDCTMIGTIFVNFLSNALSTAVKNAEVSLDSSVKLESIGFKEEENKFITGPIQYGQSRDFIFTFQPSSKKMMISAKLTYGSVIKSGKVDDFTSTNSKDLHIERLRSIYCKALLEMLKSGPNVAAFNELKNTIKNSAFKDDEKVDGLIRDLESAKESEGQVGKALTNQDWYMKWGCHYLRSLIRAHQLQQCHNFKDPGVQLYGGDFFKGVQDKADNVFCSLPAPKPSIICYAPPPNYVYHAPDMRTYMNFTGGCFDGEGLVELANGDKKRVKDIKRGDHIVCVNGTAKVIALVKTMTKSSIELVNIGNVKLTPWHPVRIGGVWKFPCKVAPVVTEYCEAVYNLVLDKEHIVIINGQEVVTLGHGLKDNKVVEHAYFGTEKVLDDLKRFKGWEKGNVVIEHWNAVRDPITQLVKGLIH